MTFTYREHPLELLEGGGRLQHGGECGYGGSSETGFAQAEQVIANMKLEKD